MELILVVILAVLLYFLPAIIAMKRGHKQQNSIALTNLFFGWTLLGWVICLIWSASYVDTEAKVRVGTMDQPSHGAGIRQR
jgi:hypothetical protein